MKSNVSNKLWAALFGLALGASAAIAAGMGTIEGTVVGPGGAVMTKGVDLRITCGAVHRYARVDGAGHFSVADLPEGQCTITSTAAGMQAMTLNVTVTAGSIATLLVNMYPPAPPMPPMEAMPMPEAVAAPAPAVMPEPKGMAVPKAPDRRPAPMHAAKPMMLPPPPPPKDARAAGPVAIDAALARERPVKLKELAKADAKAERFAGRAHIAQDRVAADDEELDQQPVLENGWSVVRVFPVPQYTKNYDGPRTDFRETIYWNPTVSTNKSGDADVTFVASDAITAFRATAEGLSATGTPGAGQVAIQSKMPLTLDAHLPVEVTSGDEISLPVTITNETDGPLDANLDATFGKAFALASNPAAAPIHLKAGEKTSLFFPLKVVASDGNADVDLALSTRGLKDELKKTIRVVPLGFPFEASASGTAHGGQVAHHEVDLAGALPGTIKATITMYPSPLAAMTKGMEGMIREPGGCFEQTSSTNYPNIMILGYLNQNDAADPALLAKTQGVLDHGYKLLTGYETPQKGYEWFGKTPGHEALTAYGLMEFEDMGKVYDVDHKMVERTADWLMSRRDHKGGFTRNSEALDSFGRASEQTTNAYIMWALSEAKRAKGMDPELGVQRALGGSTSDPYLLALATNTALLNAPGTPETAAMIGKLAKAQAKDGGFAGAKESITMSGGQSLEIETTALATLALIKASPANEYETQIRAAVDFLNARRGGYGEWGNTQATVLGLKALTAYTEHARQMAAPGSATLMVNGKAAGTISFDKGRKDALVWDDLANYLAPGKNTIELRLDSTATLPYTISIEYRSPRPQSSAAAKIAVTTELAKTQAKMGEGVRLRAHVENKTAAGVPMTLARVGIPGGMVFQTWQLKELRDKGIIDFYETRPREVILYWRALAPSAKKDVNLDLLAAVPGTYEAPASSAYLYYTAEDKDWTPPVKIEIDR